MSNIKEKSDIVFANRFHVGLPWRRPRASFVFVLTSDFFFLFVNFRLIDFMNPFPLSHTFSVSWRAFIASASLSSSKVIRACMKVTKLLPACISGLVSLKWAYNLHRLPLVKIDCNFFFKFCGDKCHHLWSHWCCLSRTLVDCSGSKEWFGPRPGQSWLRISVWVDLSQMDARPRLLGHSNRTLGHGWQDPWLWHIWQDPPANCNMFKLYFNFFSNILF